MANELVVLALAYEDNLSPQHTYHHFVFHFVYSDKVMLFNTLLPKKGQNVKEENP